jgi:streptomycin 6-kinase
MKSAPRCETRARHRRRSPRPPRSRGAIRRLSSDLALDATRVLEWAFAQAVLSAIWVIEDGETFDAAAPTMILAETMRRMLPSFSS